MTIKMSGGFRGQKGGRDSITLEPGRPVVLTEDGWHYQDELVPIWGRCAKWAFALLSLVAALAAFFSEIPVGGSP